MPRDVVITPPLFILAKVLHLEDCEVVCETCHGEGTVVWEYHDPGPNRNGPCMDCGGKGKRFKCKGCGQLQHYGMIKHQDQPEYDGFCLFCLKFKIQTETDKKVGEIGRKEA